MFYLLLIFSSSTSTITKTYFPRPGFSDSLTESFFHPPEVNLSPATPGECQLIHLPPLTAITSISTYQKYVTGGTDEKQRYSYKPKPERHLYWREKTVTQQFHSPQGTEYQLQKLSTLCLSGGPSGYHLLLLFNQLRGLPVLGNSHM